MRIVLQVGDMREGISAETLGIVQALDRGTQGPFTAREAAELLSADVESVRKLLAYLAERGWLTRVRHGLYIVPPLDATDPSAWREDPWVLAHKSFAPCYIGGWSACEHWGLTDQIFREIMVISQRQLRRRRADMQGVPFRVKVRPAEKHFGTVSVWRGQVRVSVSDPSRTIVDILDDPSIGGGMRHVSGVLLSYMDGDNRNETLLIDYADQFGNRTVFKRLGYVVEALSIDAPKLVLECLRRKSKGLTALDPSASSGERISRRWNLRINVAIVGDGERVA